MVGRRASAALALSSLLTACLLPHTTESPPQDRACPTMGDGAGTSLTWYVPDSSTESKTAEQWCLATGPAVIDSTPSAGFGPWRPGDSLVVVAWNVSAGGGDLLAFLDEQTGLSCDVRSAALAPGASHFVLLLQEAYRRSAAVPADADESVIPPAVKEESRAGERADVVEVARRCGLALAYVPATRNGTGEWESEREDKGNAILSTLPLSDVIAVEMPMVAQRRVELAATVRDARGDSLRVVSVHLNTFPPPWRLLRTGGSSRVRQALTLVDALQRAELERSGRAADSVFAGCYPTCGDEETPSYVISTVAGGDINTWTGGGTALKQLYLHFPDSPPYDPTPTRTSFRTDHMLFRSAGTGSAGTLIEGSYRRLDSAYHSDHYPITVWFRFGYR
jgi:endonuclease/exonuclease/phosphatase family metal-dependent hydrolase